MGKLELDVVIACNNSNCNFVAPAKIPLEWVTHQSEKHKVTGDTGSVVRDHHKKTVPPDREVCGHDSYSVSKPGAEQPLGEINGHRDYLRFTPRHYEKIYEKIRADYDKVMEKHQPLRYYKDYRD